jgi:hypothetical protein
MLVLASGVAALRRARAAILVSSAGACLLGLVLVALELTDEGGAIFTRDVASTGGLPPWAGAVSLLGLVVWGGAAGTCALGGIVARRQRSPSASFLLATAALLVVLAVDDAMQIHETVGPAYIGVGELAVYGVLALAVIAWVGAFWRQISASAWPTLMLAAGWFAGSLVLDVAGRGPVTFEDWFKYSGLMTLAAWSLGESARVVMEAHAPEAHVPRNGPEIS